MDRLFYVVDGEGWATLAGSSYPIEKGHAVCVSANVEHNLTSSDDETLKLFTVYSPTQHRRRGDSARRPRGCRTGSMICLSGSFCSGTSAPDESPGR